MSTVYKVATVTLKDGPKARLSVVDVDTNNLKRTVKLRHYHSSLGVFYFGRSDIKANS